VDNKLNDKLSIMTLLNGSSVLSVVLEETYDSFIIGFASRLLKGDGDGEPLVEPIYPVPKSRLFKAGLLSQIPLTSPFEIPYLDYLLNNSAVAIDNGILSEEELELIMDRLEKAEDAVFLGSDDDEEKLDEIPDRIDYIFPEGGEIH